MAFHVKVSKHRPAVESLARRVVDGQPLPHISPLVCIFNAISLQFLVPSGADDLDKVEGDLRLTFAEGDELYVPFNSSTVEHPRPGEIIYADDAKVLCRHWCWRQADQTKLTAETTRVAVNIDILPPLGKDDAMLAAEEMARLIRDFCGGDAAYYMISREQPVVEFAA
jgi:lysyl-tRNA synthetase class 2